MALPRQVEAQLKELEAIEQQLAQAQNQPKDKPADVPENPEEPVPAPAEPTESNQPAPDPKPEAKPEKPTEPQVAEETWQQKYRTLKGMYDAEVPRLHAQVKELTSRAEQLQRSMEAPKPAPAAPEPVTKLVTDADVEAFGSDLIEVQRKVAREVAAEFRKELDDLKGENAKLREQLTDTGTKVSEASFEQRLHRLVPDFDKVNADPKWIEWLNEVDPLLRGPRKAVAQHAFNTGDAEGVAHYIQLFKETLAPVEQPVDRSAELARQIQPPRSAASTSQPSPKGRTYTTADIDKMFRQVADLGNKGRLEEARKLEAEIDAAYTEGRVSA